LVHGIVKTFQPQREEKTTEVRGTFTCNFNSQFRWNSLSQCWKRTCSSPLEICENSGARLCRYGLIVRSASAWDVLLRSGLPLRLALAIKKSFLGDICTCHASQLSSDVTVDSAQIPIDAAAASYLLDIKRFKDFRRTVPKSDNVVQPYFNGIVGLLWTLWAALRS